MKLFSGTLGQVYCRFLGMTITWEPTVKVE